MKFSSALLPFAYLLVSPVLASVFLPYQPAGTVTTTRPGFFSSSSNDVFPSLSRRQKYDFRLALRKQVSPVSSAAMAIPGYGVAEQVFVGGFANFLSIYNLIITARILLSWFPQAQGIGALQPVYAITDPYLNLFRGVVPPLFGLDFSPILAFFLLNLLGNATAAVGYEIPPDLRQKKKYSALRPSRGGMIARLLPQQRPTVFRSRHNNNNKKQNDLTLNY